MKEDDSHRKAHWKSTLKITLSLLGVWFIVSFVCAILCRDWMDANMPNIGNAPFGFWMAQQGSIICFVILLIVYAVLMNRLDKNTDTLRRNNDEPNTLNFILLVLVCPLYLYRIAIQGRIYKRVLHCRRWSFSIC